MVSSLGFPFASYIPVWSRRRWQQKHQWCLQNYPNKSLLSLETTQISSMVEWLNKLKNNHGLHLNRKKKQTTDTCNNLDGSPEINAEWKIQFQKVIYGFILCITCWKWQNHRNGCQGFKEELVPEGSMCVYKSATGGILVVIKFFLYL